MRSLKFSMLLLTLWFGGQPAWAEGNHPTLRSPDFQFSQIDKICVMPWIDARTDATLPLDLSPMRPLVMLALEERGYRIASPGCSAQGNAGATGTHGWRWLLTVRVDGLFPVGSLLTASLFDTETSKEVWRDTAMTGFRGRFKNATYFSMEGVVLVDDLIKSGIDPVLATFEKRKKRSSEDLGHGPDETWPPQILQVRNLRHGDCPGDLSLSLDSGLLSFESRDKKCRKDVFSAPLGQVTSLGYNRFKVISVSISGKGTYHFATTDEAGFNYMLAAWRLH